MLHPETIRVVQELAERGKARFRASYVAEQAHLPVEKAREDLASLVKLGDLQMNLELMCPDDGRTLKTFSIGEEIPRRFSHWECSGGEEFEVTPNLIWVTYSPTPQLTSEIGTERTANDPGGGERRGNVQGPQRRKPGRAPTSSRGIWKGRNLQLSRTCVERPWSSIST